MRAPPWTPRIRTAGTALHAAALGGDDAIAKALLAKGADLNAEDQAGSTALTYAAANGHDRFVQMLQTAGLKKGSEMALALAARGCYPETLAILLKSKASSNARMQGKPALSLAAAAGCEGSVRALLAAGADVNAKDDEGTTALMEAANMGLVPIVQLLLDKGADPELRNNAGQNAWLLAAMSQQKDVIEIFRKSERSGDRGHGLIAICIIFRNLTGMPSRVAGWNRHSRAAASTI